MTWRNFIEDFILADESKRVQLHAKSRPLAAAGHVADIDIGIRATVAEFPGTVKNETFVTGNDIDSIVSSDASDTGDVLIFGYTLSGEEMSVSLQTVTLTGQTPALLGVPLFRCNKIVPSSTGTIAVPAPSMEGDVSVYDSSATAVTDGVPDTDEAVKCLIVAGNHESFKCAGCIGTAEYGLVDSITADVHRSLGNGNAQIEVAVEYRRLGTESWFRVGIGSMRTDSLPVFTQDLNPWAIIPRNSDFRMIGESDSANLAVNGTVRGVIASVVQ